MKFLRYMVAAALILSIGLAANAAGYCPTNMEIRAKAQSWQQRAMAGMSSPYSTLADAEALLNEQDNYLNSIIPNCIQYYKTTKNPDCNRLESLAMGYMLLPDTKRQMAKLQIYNTVAPFITKCDAEFKMLKIMVK